MTDDFKETMNDHLQETLKGIDEDIDFQNQLALQRKKDRIRFAITGFAVGLMLTIGVGVYLSEANGLSNSDSQASTADYYGGTLTSTGLTSGSGSSASGVSGAGAGGCCGGGAGAGSSNSSTSLTDLEKQGLESYQKETGKTDVTAKAKNFGCHIQVDILDKTGNVVRSYGYQGGPLYVIK